VILRSIFTFDVGKRNNDSCFNVRCPERGARRGLVPCNSRLNGWRCVVGMALPRMLFPTMMDDFGALFLTAESAEDAEIVWPSLLALCVLGALCGQNGATSI
jgi:hypothetical protein